jgi:phage-related protein
MSTILASPAVETWDNLSGISLSSHCVGKDKLRLIMAEYYTLDKYNPQSYTTKVIEYDYYKTRRGELPVRDWLEKLPIKERAVVHHKIHKLSEVGLRLLKTDMLTNLHGYGGDFYELRTGQLRIAVYFDRAKDLILLLHGWRKKKQNQPHDISIAAQRLREYLAD